MNLNPARPVVDRAFRVGQKPLENTALRRFGKSEEVTELVSFCYLRTRHLLPGNIL